MRYIYRPLISKMAATPVAGPTDKSLSQKKIVLRSFVLMILFATGFSGTLVHAQVQKLPVKLKRADCFFGVHFDLHASEEITDAGRTLTAEMIDTFLLRVRPDFIQIDCKGHPGISSYPTRVGYHVKGFDKDPLKLFHEITEKNKVALFVHYSGVWDNKAVKEHPDWAIVKADGEKSTEKISFFSPYLEKLMIPQLREISDYGVDGAWIDGECWAVEPDYGEASLKRFREETGIIEIPKKPADKYYPEFMEYTRSLFREHMNKYINAIHQYNPDFQITSNWAYSSIMPERVNSNVDFLSGDFSPQNAVYGSAFQARCLASQGKTWDLMAWGFSWNNGNMPMSIKSAVQLEQEAAQVISMGGGIQFYFQQNRDLSLKPWIAEILSEVGEFCRERQQYCHKAQPIPQIALLYPNVAYQKNGTRPYANSTGMLEGTLNLVLDGQHPVEILMEHQLSVKMDQFPLIIIPECDYLEPILLEKLRKYLRGGGRLLVIGTETAKLFEKELGIRSMENVEIGKTFIATSGIIGAIRSSVLSVELLTGAEELSTFYTGNDLREKDYKISSSVNKVGKGMAGGIYFNAGSAYREYKSPVLRDFINSHILAMFPGQLVNVQGSRLVHVAVNRLNDKMYINLVNVAGEHTNPTAIGFDEIPSLKDLKISIKTVRKPEKILLQPENRELEFNFQNGVVTTAVSDLAIHSILELIF